MLVEYINERDFSMAKKRKAVSSFGQLARKISRDGHLQRNSKASQLVVLVVSIRILTEISFCSFVKEASGIVFHSGVGLAAVLMQPVPALAVSCATCTSRTIAGTTEIT